MSAIDPETLRLMRLILAAPRTPRRNALREARELCRALHPALPSTTIEDAVAALAEGWRPGRGPRGALPLSGSPRWGASDAPQNPRGKVREWGGA